MMGLTKLHLTLVGEKYKLIKALFAESNNDYAVDYCQLRRTRLKLVMVMETNQL
jgi:hypothetical protein